MDGGQIDILKAVVRTPSAAFRKISKSSRKRGKNRYLGGAVSVLLLASLVPWVILPEFFPFVGGVVAGIRNVVVYIIFIYCVGNLAGGRGKFPGMFSAIGYSYLPAIFSSAAIGVAARLSAGTIRQIIDIHPDLPQEQIAMEVAPLVEELLADPTFVSLIMLGLLIGAWRFVLTILACREAHKFSTARAVGTIIIAALLTGIVVNIITGLF